MKSAFAATLNSHYQIAGAAAVFHPNIGPDVNCRAILEHPDRDAQALGIGVVYDGPVARVRVSDVADPKKGDVVAIDGQDYQIVKVRSGDIHRLQWHLELREI